MLWVKFVVSSQWTVVQFLVGLIIFMVVVWALDSDPRPGRLRISTDERSVKLVADALEEDRHATCGKSSRTTGVKTSLENSQEPTSVACGWTTHFPWQCLSIHFRCCNQKTSRLWVGSVTSCALHVETWVHQTLTYSQVKRTYTWTMFILSGIAFHHWYLSFSTHE